MQITEKKGAQRPEQSLATDKSVADTLVHTLRLWCAGRENWWSIVTAMRNLVGEDHAAEPLLGLRGILESLGQHARATLMVHGIDAPDYSAHEKSILTLIAALQSDQREHATLISTWLVPRAERQELLGHASLLAEKLTALGAVLDMPKVATCRPVDPNRVPCSPVPSA